MGVLSFIKNLFQPSEDSWGRDINRPSPPRYYTKLLLHSSQYEKEIEQKNWNLSAIKKCDNFHIDEVNQCITYTLYNQSKVKVRYAVLGYYSTTDKTWNWSWSDIEYNYKYFEELTRLRNYGHTKRIALLSKIEWLATIEECKEIAQVANFILKRNGVLEIEREGKIFYFAIDEILSF